MILTRWTHCPRVWSNPAWEAPVGCGHLWWYFLSDFFPNLVLCLHELVKILPLRRVSTWSGTQRTLQSCTKKRRGWSSECRPGRPRHFPVDERSKKGNVVQTYQVPAERFTNVEVSLQCHSYHGVNAPWRYKEMFLRIICQGSHSHSVGRSFLFFREVIK